MNSLDFLNSNRNPAALIPFADRLEAKLEPLGAANLLCASIRIAPQDVACTLMNAALHDLSAGQPMTPFLGYADEATFWTSIASLDERKIYMAAIWQSLPKNEQSEFWKFVQRRAAA